MADLWQRVDAKTVERFSILEGSVAAQARVSYPNGLFVWVAWGEKAVREAPCLYLPLKMAAKAMNFAKHSGCDLVGVAEDWSEGGTGFSAHRYDAQAKKWLFYQGGQPLICEEPGGGGITFPVHPFDLGQKWAGPNGVGEPAVISDLVDALVASAERKCIR